MIKKLLLSILCLSLFSGDVDALTKRQKRVIQVIGGGALATAAAIYTFLGSCVSRKNRLAEHTLYCHYDKSAGKWMFDFDKNLLYNHPKQPGAPQPKGSKYPNYIFKDWRDDELRAFDLFLETETNAPNDKVIIGKDQIQKVRKGTKEKLEEVKIDQDHPVQLPPFDLAKFGKALASPCDVWGQGKIVGTNIYRKCSSLCSSKKPKAGEAY